MTRLPPTAALVFGWLWVLACQPDPGEEAGDPDTQANADGDRAEEPGSPDDAWNCGELGLTCVGPLGIGECVEGVCQGRLTQGCYSATETCAEICGSLEATCDPLGCDGATAWVWNASTKEEADYLCLAADREAAEALKIGCEDELVGLAESVNCCCRW